MRDLPVFMQVYKEYVKEEGGGGKIVCSYA